MCRQQIPNPAAVLCLASEGWRWAPCPTGNRVRIGGGMRTQLSGGKPTSGGLLPAPRPAAVPGLPCRGGVRRREPGSSLGHVQGPSLPVGGRTGAPVNDHPVTSGLQGAKSLGARGQCRPLQRGFHRGLPGSRGGNWGAWCSRAVGDRSGVGSASPQRCSPHLSPFPSPSMFQTLYSYFWWERLWLPANLTWADLEDRDGRVYAKASDLYITLPLAFLFLVVRHLFET